MIFNELYNLNCFLDDALAYRKGKIMSCNFNRYFNISPWDSSKFCMIPMCAR